VKLLALPLAAVAALAFAGPASRPAPPRSGLDFAAPDVRALQADDFANPGMLWVEKGAAMWRLKDGAAGKACADCHADAVATMKGIAAGYPRIDRETGVLVDLEGRINICRTQKQRAPAWAPESPELLNLTAYVARQSRGTPIAFSADARLEPYLERGRALYHQRIGQMNLACTHCHDESWGRRLLGETISQGQPAAYPAYKLNWESVGSLSRRLRACFYGVGAQMPDYASPDLLDLKVYLAWRAHGLPMESPGVRR
jgi:sulfur-oxidizing protein SoxA